jgi:hypothetical protein
MNLQNWEKAAEKHLKEFLPNQYKQLKQTGQLQQHLKQAAEQTYQEMNQLEAQGYSPEEAWVVVRENHLLPKPEAQEPSEPNGLMQEAMQLHSKALQSDQYQGAIVIE